MAEYIIRYPRKKLVIAHVKENRAVLSFAMVTTIGPCVMGYGVELGREGRTELVTGVELVRDPYNPDYIARAVEMCMMYVLLVEPEVIKEEGKPEIRPVPLEESVEEEKKGREEKWERPQLYIIQPADNGERGGGES